MASLAQLQSEGVWNAEVVPASLDRVFRDLCRHFGTSPAGGGTRGNGAHLTGRHRSRRWVQTSRWCQDTFYGTRDLRDLRGNADHVRAFDVPLSPQQMVTVCRRLDTAVRAGRLPQVAEWFGTLDNRTVTGWYEGHPSSSDDSHLSHVHIGLWTENAADDHRGLFAVLTGTSDGGDDVSAADVWAARFKGKSASGATFDFSAQEFVVGGNDAAWRAVGAVAALDGKVTAQAAADELRDRAVLASIEALKANGGIDVAPAVEAVRALHDEARTRFGELHEELAAARTEAAELRARLAAALADQPT